MAKSTKSSDGLKKIGPGKWEARITARDPVTGKKTTDTTRTIEADTKLQALQKRQELRDELVGAEGEWTVNQAIDVWLKTLRYGSLSVRRSHTKRFRAKFGSKKLSTVEPQLIQRWLAELEGTDLTANLHRATMIAVYRHAREKGWLRGKNPMEGTVRRLTPKTNEDYLADLDDDEPERRALVGDDLPSFFLSLEAHSPDVYPLMKLQLLLGCRVAEVMALQWRDINWETGAVTIRRSQSHNGEMGPPKNKKKRVAALGPEGLAFLRGHKADMERKQWQGFELWVFPRPDFGPRRNYDTWVYETVRIRVKAALEYAGIELENATHAMRHTHVTLARALQVDAMLRASVGHSGAKLTENYTDDSARAVEAVGYARDFEVRLAGAGGVSGGGTVTDIKKLLRK